MPVLFNSKHELFAQGVVKGLSHTEAYISAGYSKAGARQNAQRLITVEPISARIKELQTAVADYVVTVEIRKRSWRLQQLQDLVDDMLALRAARKNLYAGQMGEGRTLQVNNATEEGQAIAEGFSELATSPAGDVYPKTLYHPGYHNGAATGMLVKDYRGKNAEQEIWKFDAALVEKIANVLKQAAIEEGQWSEKRDQTPQAIAPVRVTVVFVTPPAIEPGKLESGRTIDVRPSGRARIS